MYLFRAFNKQRFLPTLRCACYPSHPSQAMSTQPPGAGGASPFDEHRWIIEIRHTLDEPLDEDEGDVAVSVFNVPKTLLSSKPEAYTPQLLALGPYHHWRPELYDMERYKLSAAKRTQRHLPNAKLQHLVDGYAKHENRIRAHYHRFLEFNGETLAWMMAVDASFLVEFLQIYAIEEGGKILHRLSSRMCHLVDFERRKSAHNIILRDIVMLENQVPLFLLRKLLDLRYSSSELGDDALEKMVTGFMKELCPFKTMETFPWIDVAQHAHLLEALYHVLVPKSEEKQGDNNEEIEEQNDGEGAGPGEQWKGDPSYVRQLLGAIWGFASGVINGRPVSYISQALGSRPVTFVVKVPWKILTSLPGFSMLKQSVEYLFTQESSSKKGDDGDPSSAAKNPNKPPLIEEIMIPSVAELASAGVRFRPTGGDVTSVDFDPRTATFYLPAVTLDVNTEVVLRNLVAYEAAAAGGPLVLTRYTELMNGIVDTEEDVRLLRRSGVVVNRMKSDGEAAELWNGMSRSVRLTRVGFLDRAIEEVNRYYGSRWRVRTGTFMRKYVFRSWPFLTFMAAVLLLLLTGLQAFCSVYSCARWFHVPTAGRQ